jgi:hypothetical protein
MAGSQIDSIKFAADAALSVPNLIDLRQYSVTLNTVIWSGARPGLGTVTNISVPVFNFDGYFEGQPNDGYVNPKFRQVNKQEIVLSGGVLKDQDVVIGPFVFPYDDGLGDSGGLDPTVFSPQISMTTEFYINIQGPNFPVGGSNFKKIWDNTQLNVMYRVYLRNTGSNPP